MQNSHNMHGMPMQGQQQGVVQQQGYQQQPAPFCGVPGSELAVMAQAAWGQMDGGMHGGGMHGHPGMQDPTRGHAPNHPEQPAVSLSAQAELELELSLRGSLLVQQQRRIVQLEDELQRAWTEIDRLRTKIASVERDRQRTDDDSSKQARLLRSRPPLPEIPLRAALAARSRTQTSPVHAVRPGLCTGAAVWFRLTLLAPPAARVSQQPRYWTPEEHRLFMEAVQRYGWKDVKSIAQVRSGAVVAHRAALAAGGLATVAWRRCTAVLLMAAAPHEARTPPSRDRRPSGRGRRRRCALTRRSSSFGSKRRRRGACSPPRAARGTCPTCPS